MKYTITLKGGPLDGAVVDIEPEDPAGVDKAQELVLLTFGGLVYDVDFIAGIGYFVSGRDEANILDSLGG